MPFALGVGLSVGYSPPRLYPRTRRIHLLLNEGTSLFGTNVVMLQEEPWKKHRRVLNPAFSNKLYALVWKESMRMFRDMVDTEAWDKKQSVDIPLLNDLTTKIGYLIHRSSALF
ncbi:hypothetical protein BOTBODRAFT_566618 [Botryobasidium botryosum FD-172 SS1]|uniref:Cytochrome P450 n=1 Tax=Botryobasidium botryosum (strain FD-172 SS1) TaxID=930990 RepID=A0A067M9E2_BOTB1|nr:hypothetical protein BOTBODRAFT_566618 [Botryobasidium botryosum FD-172 SS1]